MSTGASHPRRTSSGPTSWACSRSSRRPGGADVKRFLQISTDEVYGSTVSGSFGELNILDPSSPYSASKAGGELLARSYVRTYGLNVMVSRSSNNYGPFQYPEKLIPVLVLKALRDEPLPIYGKGMNIRDWLHVDDNCRAIDLVLWPRASPGTSSTSAPGTRCRTSMSRSSYSGT